MIKCTIGIREVFTGNAKRMKKIKLTRRDFIKISLAGGGTIAGAYILSRIFGVEFPLSTSPTATATPSQTSLPTTTPTITTTPTETPKPRLSAAEMEQQIEAVKLPIVEYHYLGYHAGGVLESEEMFISNMDFFQQAGYHTIDDVQLAQFLGSEISLPAKSFAIRIDQGAANWDPFVQMLGIIRDHGFQAMVFVISGENYTDAQWGQLAEWYKDGLISIGSHSVHHPNFSELTYQQAYEEAYFSKKAIEQKLADLGIETQLVGFAFPSDDQPDNVDFLKSAGYKFGLSGNLFGPSRNAAKPGQLLVPTLYPYVSQAWLDARAANKNNPRCFVLTSGYTFEDLIYMNTTPITVEVIEGILGEPYPEKQFAPVTELPIGDEQKASLERPIGIIIHTDAQDGNSWDSWKTSATYNGLLQRDSDVHFAVDRQGPVQFLKMYEDFCTPTRGAIGFSDFISIEMCGRDYNDVMDPEADANKVVVIKDITANTIALVKTLVEQYNIDIENILGHYQASASGKADPGKAYFEQYFLPQLSKAVSD
jgi:peptidoglycan/xylan/chitin deacetylase (PgdA/CDA1 family)